MNKQSICCSCEHCFDANYSKEIILTSKLITEIIEGQFQSYPCPSCGRLVKTELEAQIDFDHLRFYYYPEKERNHFLIGKILVPPSIYRVCFGYKELVEKIQIKQNQLDDRAIEILKYSYLQRLQQPERISLFFHDTKDEKLEFYVYGLMTDKIGITAVQMSFYEKVVASMNHPLEEWKQIMQPPYVSVEKINCENPS